MEKVGGLLIVVLGLQMMGILKLKFLMSSKQLGNGKKYGGWLGSFILGLKLGRAGRHVWGSHFPRYLFWQGRPNHCTKG
ncbi:hypothetical protein MF627_07575 [Paenibacillus polymyxa]|nr:hypothetical protein MF627_07575 [Paenibacillus polymyxa]